MRISTKNVKSIKKLFHNIRLNVYPMEIPFSKIEFWPDNYRTILSFDVLQSQYGKIPFSKIPRDNIIDFLSSRQDLKLPELANSIRQNGVKVPLIILDDGILLDGNRRYFACAILDKKARKENTNRPDILENIPVLVIKEKDIDDRAKQKILAEANFVNDYRVPWPLDVKAKVITTYFKTCKKAGMSEDKIYEEINDVYSVDPQTVDAYRETIRLTREFRKTATKKERNRYREIVQDKFLYFWEFRNKALKGQQILSKKELSETKDLFFSMIEKDRFKNFKQVEPMIRAKKDPYRWGLLSGSGGTKIDQIEALHKEEKAIRSVEDKIRNFLTWLKKANIENLTKSARRLLVKVRKLCANILKDN